MDPEENADDVDEEAEIQHPDRDQLHPVTFVMFLGDAIGVVVSVVRSIGQKNITIGAI